MDAKLFEVSRLDSASKIYGKSSGIVGSWNITELSSMQKPRKFSVPTSLGIIRWVMKMLMMRIIRVSMMIMLPEKKACIKNKKI